MHAKDSSNKCHTIITRSQAIITKYITLLPMIQTMRIIQCVMTYTWHRRWYKSAQHFAQFNKEINNSHTGLEPLRNHHVHWPEDLRRVPPVLHPAE